MPVQKAAALDHQAGNPEVVFQLTFKLHEIDFILTADEALLPSFPDLLDFIFIPSFLGCDNNRPPLIREHIAIQRNIQGGRRNDPDWIFVLLIPISKKGIVRQNCIFADHNTLHIPPE
ncbi:hypothetical protein D3C71_1207140 [compost metagenome]